MVGHHWMARPRLEEAMVLSASKHKGSSWDSSRDLGAGSQWSL